MKVTSNVESGKKLENIQNLKSRKWTFAHLWQWLGTETTEGMNTESIYPLQNKKAWLL